MLLVLFIALKIFSCASTSIDIDHDPSVRPKFDQSDETVSVVVGKKAILPCFITLPEGTYYRTGSLKVIWMKMNSSSVLTMENRAINGDSRISLLRAYSEDWSLQIDEIDEDDAGVYRCFINNGMFKSVILDVKVPPRIIDELTTEAYPAAIEAGSNVTIKCYAQGKPQPQIRIISYDQFENSRVISEENELTLVHVSRQTNRRYECVASNGYPPDVARSFQLTIHYRPEVTLFLDEQIAPNEKQIENSMGELRLKCQIQMNPIERFIWMKNERPISENIQNYQIESYIISELTVRLSNEEDYTVYTCLASNSLGIDSKKIILTSLSSTRRPTPVHRHRKRPKFSRTSTHSSFLPENLRLINLSSNAMQRFSMEIIGVWLLFITVTYL